MRLVAFASPFLFGFCICGAAGAQETVAPKHTAVRLPGVMRHVGAGDARPLVVAPRAIASSPRGTRALLLPPVHFRHGTSRA